VVAAIAVLSSCASRRVSRSGRGLEIHAGPAGLEVTGPDVALRLELVAFGREGAAMPVPSSRPRADGDAIRYERGSSLVEWYLDRPAGVEQAFTLDDRPAGGGALVFEYRVRGTLHPELVSDREAVFRDASEVARFAYRDLHAEDADGRALDAAIVLADEKLALRVVDDGARYPLFIDPLIVVQEAKLLASDAAASSYFGESVAVSGDTAVVGALNGEAYALIRNGATWSGQAKLTPSTAADGFGSAVSLSGDTALVGARDFGGTTSGTAFVFVRAGTTWSQHSSGPMDQAGSGSSGGCGCRAASHEDASALWLIALAAGVALRQRRRGDTAIARALLVAARGRERR
jgi:MYXO-CTERM domain-containing protein